ncbi:hypothetical protein K505DRAFT_332313 [Melanomma pulvis-pyrius CBS 109.77]|uniref:Uncharacterized protein n=1 Tax=Melanomma pulvis-pyrius CBS 109.77 TaxID=1314802 RepID=A0A6A6XU31_9PLEO|nr:hypothetical protein K505DRAFT_332313 [Melanomma pulvis-pyrius CBS 109.77]
MKFTPALTTALLIALTTAAPALPPRETIPTITIAVTNDLTGLSATATVPGDGIARNIPDLFHGTPIDNNGAFIATSAQLVHFEDKTRCFFQNVNWIINLNGRDATFVDLDGDRAVASPVYLNGFNLQCV